MNIAGWILAPLKTVLAILHTALCSITGLIAMALNAHNGDWVMWQVGRQMWSRPLLQVILGAKLDINVHPKRKRWQTNSRASYWWPTTPACLTSMLLLPPVPRP